MKPRRNAPQRINLVERAIIAHEWNHTALEAQMLAMCSLDSDKLVNKAGRMLFVVLGATIAEELDPDMPEIRIIRGSANALHDQAGDPEVHPQHRAAIIQGLQRAADLIPLLPRKALVDAACALHLKLKHGDLMTSDFQALMGKASQPHFQGVN